MRSDRKGIVFALAAALCFGAIPAIAKSAYAGGISVLALLSFRYLLASAILLPVACLKERGKLPPVGLIVKIMLVAGIFLALEAGLYFYSLTRLPSSLAALILFTYPLFVNIIGLFRGDAKLTWGIGLSMLLCLAGFAALLGPDFGHIDTIGILCAFLAAISYSVYLVLIDRLIAGISPAVTNAIVSLSNAVTMSAAALVTGSFAVAFQPSVWFTIALLVVVSNLAGFYLFFAGLKLLRPERTSMLNMTEPLFTVLIGVLLLGEHLAAVQMAGGLVMVFGLVLFVQMQSRAAQPRTESPAI
jgi:drug/metabolite transporter (DMT)-like permease